MLQPGLQAFLLDGVTPRERSAAMPTYAYAWEIGESGGALAFRSRGLPVGRGLHVWDRGGDQRGRTGLLHWKHRSGKTQRTKAGAAPTTVGVALQWHRPLMLWGRV